MKFNFIFTNFEKDRSMDRTSIMVMNMRYMCQVLLLSSLSMIALQSSIASCSLQRLRQGGEKEEMSMTSLLDQYFESEPGNVISKQVFNISMPKGHVGIISFDAELVDGNGNPIPLHDTYLHHWFIVKYHQNITGGGDMSFQRNSGACTGHHLPHYWGLGADSRKTKSDIPFPYAIEIGNPANIPKGMQEKWMVNLMAIDVRGAHDKKACTECRCDAFSVPKEYLDNKLGFDMKNLTSAYKGGMFCCEPEFRCKLRKANPYRKRNMTLKYKVKYVNWDDFLVPLRVYILDVAEKVVSDGDKVQRVCISEYSIPEKVEGGSPYHIKRTQIPMDKGGYVIYATAHVHAGAVNTTLYGADGRVICNSTAIEGKGKEAGNENGFVVGMTVCYPEPGTVKIKTNETVTVEFVYKAGYHTGVMGHFYLYLADDVPNLMNRQEFLYGSDLVASAPFNGQLGLEAIA